MNVDTVLALAYYLAQIRHPDEFRVALGPSGQNAHLQPGIGSLVGQARRLTLANQIAASYVRLLGGSEEEVHRAALYQLLCDGRFFPHTLQWIPAYPWESEIRGMLLYSDPVPELHPQLQRVTAEELWGKDFEKGNPWHALWLLMTSFDDRDRAQLAYQRFITCRRTMDRARWSCMVPVIAGCLCDSRIAGEGLSVGDQCRSVWCAATYAAARLAFPDMTPEEICGESALYLHNRRYPPTRGLTLTLASIEADWFGQLP